MPNRIFHASLNTSKKVSGMYSHRLVYLHKNLEKVGFVKQHRIGK